MWDWEWFVSNITTTGYLYYVQCGAGHNDMFNYLVNHMPCWTTLVSPSQPSKMKYLKQSDHWICPLPLPAWWPENSIETGSSPPVTACCESSMSKHLVHPGGPWPGLWCFHDKNPLLYLLGYSATDSWLQPLVLVWRERGWTLKDLGFIQ